MTFRLGDKQLSTGKVGSEECRTTGLPRGRQRIVPVKFDSDVKDNFLKRKISVGSYQVRPELFYCNITALCST